MNNRHERRKQCEPQTNERTDVVWNRQREGKDDAVRIEANPKKEITCEPTYRDASRRKLKNITNETVCSNQKVCELTPRGGQIQR